MGYVRINADSISKRALRTTKVRQKAKDKINRILESEKKDLINNFDNHAVTKEIQSGPRAFNISGTLGGYGNLFSFIGFHENTDPITPVRNLLLDIRIKTLKIVKQKYYATVQYPSKDEIRSASPLPFEEGKSWVEGVENGIIGFTWYIYTRFIKGRSKEGLQSQNMNRGGQFKKTDYLFAMIAKFRNNLRG